MKLDAGNPNLMKKALRVNPHATLTSFPNTTGSKEQVKYRTGYVPLAKDPDAVPPPSISLWHQPVYVPKNLTPMRPGADDHLKFKSVGNRT
jgi:hypothetical protein